MPLVVVYDACVLYPDSLRDVLIRLALEGMVQAKWTDEILDEVFGNLTANRTDLDPERPDRTRRLMNAAVRDCLALGYEPLVPILEGLPDPDDRHVLAAAIKAHAQLIVTFNLRDFPADVLERWHIEAQHPDAFVLDQINLEPATVYAILQQIADSTTNPPRTVDDVLDQLRDKHGLLESAAALRRPT